MDHQQDEVAVVIPVKNPDFSTVVMIEKDKESISQIESSSYTSTKSLSIIDDRIAKANEKKKMLLYKAMLFLRSGGNDEATQILLIRPTGQG